MEVNALLRKKVKIRRQLKVVRDILMVLIATVFIIIGFVYALDKSGHLGDGMQNIRFGLFAFGLLICGTAIIIAVYTHNEGKEIKFFNRNNIHVQKKKKKKKSGKDETVKGKYF